MLFLVHVKCALPGRLICPLTFPERTLEMVGIIPITSVGPSCHFPYNIKYPWCFWLWGSSWLYPPLLMWALILPIYMCMEGADSLFMPPFLHFLRSAIVPAVSAVLQMASVVGLVATVATIGPLGQVALVWVSPQTI